jgi:hypothetical protein
MKRGKGEDAFPQWPRTVDLHQEWHRKERQEGKRWLGVGMLPRQGSKEEK